jgi:serine O-acetyltransferase
MRDRTLRSDVREDFRYLLSRENIELTRSARGLATCLGYALFRPGVGAVVLYRLSRALYTAHLLPFAYVLARANQLLNGVEIPPTVAIGPGFVLHHPSGVVFHGDVRLGARFHCHTGVVLGVRTARGGVTTGPPTCGDGVFIGAGAKLLGGFHVGDDSLVGANAVVLSDVPAGATAIGIPAKLVCARLDA